MTIINTRLSAMAEQVVPLYREDYHYMRVVQYLRYRIIIEYFRIISYHNSIMFIKFTV